MSGNSRCYAAALALVGWYLMVPPFNGKDFNADAPLSKWLVYAGTDTGTQCEDTKIDQYDLAQKKDDKKVVRELILSQCIASDDPRLAK